MGYVGALSTQDLERLDAPRYAGTSQTGKTGVESSYESRLHGYSGYQHIVTNARGRHVPARVTRATGLASCRLRRRRQGWNIYLSIDLDLQLLATEQLQLAIENAGMTSARGAVVALDPRSGEVLALVSAPAFDPNVFAVGMSTADILCIERRSGPATIQPGRSRYLPARVDNQTHACDRGARDRRHEHRTQEPVLRILPLAEFVAPLSRLEAPKGMAK